LVNSITLLFLIINNFKRNRNIDVLLLNLNVIIEKVSYLSFAIHKSYCIFREYKAVNEEKYHN